VPLGICVSDAGRRNPAVSAQAAATMQLLTKGRFIFGIGPGEREGNEPYGADWAKPVARFEEAMATIRALWNSNGELVNRDSPFFPLRNAIFDLPPYRGKWPPIRVAAHGPRMLRIALRRRVLSRFPALAPGLCPAVGRGARDQEAVGLRGHIRHIGTARPHDVCSRNLVPPAIPGFEIGYAFATGPDGD